jgi:hypothetical protein
MGRGTHPSKSREKTAVPSAKEGSKPFKRSKKESGTIRSTKSSKFLFYLKRQNSRSYSQKPIITTQYVSGLEPG